MSNFDSQQLKLLVNPDDRLGLSRQCELLGLSRSSYYYEPVQADATNLMLMKLIDQLHSSYPYYGYRQMTAHLRLQGHWYNEKRIRRLMRLMDIRTVYPKPALSVAHPDHEVYPYLLRGLEISKSDMVWSCDITYLPLEQGFMYLVAVIDWYSRYVLSWELSNSLEVGFCLDSLTSALNHTGRKPAIFNTDQGSQFTSKRFVGQLIHHGIRVSMDGKGRAIDNVFIERLWRSVKWEDVYLKAYKHGHALWKGLDRYFKYYNFDRPHSSLGGLPPAQLYYGKS